MATLYNVVVRNRHVEGGNVAVMEFESANSATLPKIEAGAHIDVHLPNGMVRQYSLCQNPKDVGIFRLGILRDPESRGGSVSAFDDLKDGMQIQVSEPKNLFPLVKAKHAVLVGGGIGITPLITMAYQLVQENASFELHYCGQAQSNVPLLMKLEIVYWRHLPPFILNRKGPAIVSFFNLPFRT